MGTKGTKNQGLEVYIGTKLADASADIYTQVKRVTSVSEFGAEATITDVTALEDFAKEKLKGTPDFGTIDIGGRRVYTDPGQAALDAAAKDVDDEPYNIRIQLPGAGSAGANLRFTFKAIINKFKDVPGQVDGVVDFSSAAAISGAVTQSTYAIP